jgi:hypothetical protein
MRSTLVFLLAGLCLTLTGCFQTETVIHLKPDGSGTVEMTTLFNSQMADMVTGMAGDVGEAGESEEGEGTSEEAGAKPSSLGDQEGPEKAAKMGEGVTFVSSEEVEKDGFKGNKAIYAFKDVTKLNLDLEPDAPGLASEDPDRAEEDRVHFGFEKLGNGHALLTVKMPKRSDETEMKGESGETEGSESESPDAAGEMDEQSLAMARQMFGGMRVSVAVDVAGSVVKTNSLFVDGSKVTVFDLDMDKILENPDKLKELSAAGEPESIAEAAEMLKDVPGIKISPTEEMTIEFK